MSFQFHTQTIERTLKAVLNQSEDTELAGVVAEAPPFTSRVADLQQRRQRLD
jgi:hypothetical protein